MHIRTATKGDLPAILEIYNQVLLTSTAIYDDQPSSLEERLDWFEGRVAGAVGISLYGGAFGACGCQSSRCRGRRGVACCAD